MRALRVGIRSGGRLLVKVAVAVAAVAASAVGWTAGAGAQDVPNGTLAAAIRASNHPCRRVIEKETVSDKPTVMRIRCNSGVFNVTVSGGNVSDVQAAD